jgi:hypothetical protein
VRVRYALSVMQALFTHLAVFKAVLLEDGLLSGS